jgi:hypothetical protein
MRKIIGGYVDKDIMLKTAIPYNPFGYVSDGNSKSDTGTGSTGGTDSGSSSGNSITFPDLGKIPAPPPRTVPISYPNTGSGGENIIKI